jgi:hypothetical protein
MKRIIFIVVAGFLVSGLMGCVSLGKPNRSKKLKARLKNIGGF